MNNLRRALVVTALAAGLAAPVLPAQALEVEGHNYADTVTVAGVPLKLNGAGVRSQLWLKAFTVGLYLPRQTTQVSGVLAQPGAKRLRLRLLVDVPSKELVKALNRGVEKNHTEADRAPLAARLARLSELVQGMGKLAVGDAIDLDFRPGAGLALSLNGVQRGEPVPGEDLYRALLRIFIGDRPAQAELKVALLQGRAD